MPLRAPNTHPALVYLTAPHEPVDRPKHVIGRHAIDHSRPIGDLPNLHYGMGMYGPEPRGHWTATRPPTAFEHLVPGVRYEVVQGFTDYDGQPHQPGECWEFLGHNFLPHDDGLSLFVSLDGHSEWHIRLQWRDHEQGPLIDRLAEYIWAAS